MSGFVAMSRGALEHPLLQDADRFYAWFWLVANAAWKPTRAKIKGTMVSLDRSEMTYSVRFLAENWGWSKSRVDRFLAELRAEGMIETRSKIGTVAGHKAGQGQSIIRVCNYEKYQDPLKPVRDNSGTPRGTTAGQQRDKEEQGNKETRGKVVAIATRASGDAPALMPIHVFEKWNEVAKRVNKSAVRDLTPSRQQLVRARIGQYSLEDFVVVFGKVEASNFLREGRFCTFDWIMKRANFQKIIEGNYDDEPVRQIRQGQRSSFVH